MDWPTVSVIVLNYNGRQHLEDCFSSLSVMDYPAGQCELVLMDNASSDGSVEFVCQRFPVVRVIRSETNLGFAGGNNYAVERVQSEYVIFLNNDMRVAPNWLRELVEPCLSQQADGVASKILNWEGNRIDFVDAALNFMGWGNQPGYDSAKLDGWPGKELLFACGGAMLVNRRAFLEVGGFDPDYFAYFEDTDLGWRLSLAGHKIMFAPHAVVYHRHHGYWGNVCNARRLVLYERNALYGLIKNYADLTLTYTLPAALLLVLRRAYLDVQPDPSVFGYVPPALPPGPTFGPRYYLDQLWQLARRGALRELAQRTLAEAGRRLRPVRSPAPHSARHGARPVDGYFTVPTLALARLIAGQDVLRAFPELMNKRRKIQSTRRRTDRELFTLFQWSLISNFGDELFIHAMQQAIARFRLLDVFDTHQELPQLEPQLIEQSREASLALLQVMERAVALSGADEAAFRLNGPSLEETSRVLVACVGILAQADRLLWSLPDAPLGDVLGWLIEGCRQILKVTPIYE
jgi:GT2 family glycosyltransferase